MRRRGPGRRDRVSSPAVAPTDLVLETERLRLRPFRATDLDALASIFADAEMMKWYPHPFSRDESQRWIERSMERFEDDGLGLLALELRTSGSLIGDCGLIPQVVDDVPETEIGWHVRREEWGNGYAPEAARAVVRYAFQDLGIHSLISLIRPENVPSCRVAEKLGMHVEKETQHGNFRHYVYRLDPFSGTPL